MSDLFPLFPEEKSIRELGRKILEEVHEEVNRRLRNTPGFKDEPVDYNEMERPYVLPFKIGQLVDRIAALERERDESKKDFERWQKLLSDWKARVARLEEALRKYGRHTNNCSCLQPLGIGDYAACDCGWDEARKFESTAPAKREEGP